MDKYFFFFWIKHFFWTIQFIYLRIKVQCVHNIFWTIFNYYYYKKESKDLIWARSHWASSDRRQYILRQMSVWKIIRSSNLAMANPIKPLRSVQKYFRLVGIDIDPPSETSSINWRNVSFFFCLIQHFVTVAAFFVFDASTVIEFGTSFFGLNMMFYCIPYFLTLLSQRHRMFELTDNFQQFMERSKCLTIKCWIWNAFFSFLHSTPGASSRPLYVKWNGNIERMCGNIYFAMVKISCVGFLLPLAATVVLYFMGDLTEESYALPTPAKCVSNFSLTRMFIESFDCFRFAFEECPSTGTRQLAFCWRWSLKEWPLLPHRS